MTDFSAYLGLGYMGQHAYENVEKYFGNIVVDVRNESIKEAMEEGKRPTTDTYTTKEHRALPALAASVYEGWNKKGSGCTYNSATGTLNAIGVRSQKIIWSKTLCNRCMYCDR